MDMEKIIDLRSDTLTKPTEEMYEAMCKAKLGDEQNGEDPTVNLLQDMSAEKLGKEAALFVPSGTMGNLLALLTHTKPGESVILEAESHIYRCEVGGISAVAGIMPKRVKGELGVPLYRDIEDSIIREGRSLPTTTLICLENTHNAAGGTCISPYQMKYIRKIANKYNLKIHIDGARIFNAAIAQAVNPKELSKDADSIQFCLSKGLGCPFGSLLVGSKNFINQALKKRQMIGGGMRQAGIMAAAGIVALNKMINRLKEDHENAKLLAKGLLGLGMEIDMETVQTNMVYFNVPLSIIEPDKLVKNLKDNNILIGSPKGNRIRVVTYRGILTKDIKFILEKFKEVIKNC